jgi:hypothetical protein
MTTRIAYPILKYCTYSMFYSNIKSILSQMLEHYGSSMYLMLKLSFSWTDGFIHSKKSTTISYPHNKCFYEKVLSNNTTKKRGQILSPCLGDIVDSGIGLSFRLPACSLAGRYVNPMSESTISPQTGTKNFTTGFYWRIMCQSTFTENKTKRSCNWEVFKILDLIW